MTSYISPFCSGTLSNETCQDRTTLASLFTRYIPELYGYIYLVRSGCKYRNSRWTNVSSYRFSYSISYNVYCTELQSSLENKDRPPNVLMEAPLEPSVLLLNVWFEMEMNNIFCLHNNFLHVCLIGVPQGPVLCTLFISYTCKLV